MFLILRDILKYDIRWVASIEEANELADADFVFVARRPFDTPSKDRVCVFEKRKSKPLAVGVDC